MARCLYLDSFILQILLFNIFLINEASPYEKIFLENAKLCKLSDVGDVTVVKLGEKESSAKIVLQSKYFERWSGRYEFSCSFVVKAPSNHGVYAVFQALNLRKDSINGSCKDFVSLEIHQNPLKLFFKKGESTEKRFCGKIGVTESYLSDVKDIPFTDVLKYASVSENGFVAKDGLLQVTIYVAKERLNPDEKLDINIVFTSYKHDCKRRENYFQCKECEWIWQGFQSDEIQNCPYATCLNENFCNHINVVSSGTGTKVSIGAVATIILVLVIFACCVWVTRRMQIFCFHPSTNRQSRMEMNSTQRNVRLDDNVTPYGGMLPEETVPTAPPIAEDKDLPPSYSSLFPEK